MVGVDRVHDAFGDAAELSGLGFGQRIEHEFTNFFHVSGRDFDEVLVAVVGEYCEGETAVFRVGFAAYPAFIGEPIDDLRQPRQRAFGHGCEDAEPQGVAGDGAEGGEHVVFEVADVGVAA